MPKTNHIATTEEFVRRAKRKHGDQFEYSRTRYVGYKKLVTVMCRDHGPCETTPKSHLHSRSGGCSECRKNMVSESLRYTTDDFIDKARRVHGDYYDYSEVEYTGGQNKVTIVCPKHGPFRMKPYRHLEGRGCKKCAFLRIGRDRKLSFWDFVERVVEVHGPDRYEYELTDFVNVHSRIPIHCPEHGVFRQSVANHLKGTGCPRCIQSNGECRVREVLTDLRVPFVEQYRFPECRDKQPLPFDFFVPDYRLLIEFDGRQHYVMSDLWGGDEKLEETRRHDAIKNRFARNQGYLLLRIPYWQIDDVEMVVLETLISTTGESEEFG